VNDSTPESADADDAPLWQLLPQAADVADHHTDRFLQTELESEELQKRLYHIHQQARSVFEEQGYTVLYLALGFLEWSESPSALQPRRAPLILIPVELERRKVGTAFRLRWTGEELFPNLSLQAKLSEQGVALPDLEMPEDKAGRVERGRRRTTWNRQVPNHHEYHCRAPSSRKKCPVRQREDGRPGSGEESA
jgi:hypothetical protein